MKIRIPQIIYQAVCAGIMRGMHAANSAPESTPNQIIEILGSAVMEELSYIIDLEDSSELQVMKQMQTILSQQPAEENKQNESDLATASPEQPKQ